MRTKEELETLILGYQKTYYNGVSTISDSEFDLLWDELLTNYPDSELLDEVGEDSLDGFKIKHVIPMGSQSKVTSLEELSKWIISKNIKFPLILQDKLDGISVELVYKDGFLKNAITRGNGVEGTSILKNVLEIPRLPLTITCKDDVFIRGEIVMNLSKMNSLKGFEGRDVLSPRNIAAGIAYQKYGVENCDCLNVVCYDLDIKAESITTEYDKIEWLSHSGFLTPNIDFVDNLDELESHIEKFESFKLSDTREYDIDGVVLKQDLIPLIIDSSRVRPEHQRAYKWKSEEKWTKLLSVEWSRSGNNYTPVAILEPTELSGTVVERASLANLAEIRRLGITKIPCKVLVTKRGEIIPKVMEVGEVDDVSVELETLLECPFCKEPLTITDSRVFCSNEDCISKKEHVIVKWINTTGALGFGPALTNHIIYVGKVRNVSDLYNNMIMKDCIDKTNNKKALTKAFNDLYIKSKRMPLENIISGFDIEGIGSKVVKLVINNGFDTVDKLMNITYNELISMDGFGEVRANTFLTEVPKLKDEINNLLRSKSIGILRDTKVEKDGKNLSFVITGKLSSPRKVIEALIEENGCNIKSTINKTVDYLINNDIESKSSKNVKAKELGIKIITEEEAMAILNDD